MIPKVAARGHSFKGAGQYYLHDKDKAQTSDRVGWTHMHNINTADPHKAMKCMAYTAMNANKLKQEMGVKATGRKASAGAVYSYSLAWHPSEQPEKQTMLNSAFETLEKLGLKDHQAVIVQHQETDHPHVHVLVNLVNPQNGKTAVMSCDRLTLSEWAQAYEQKHGIHCEKRVENNQKRKDLSNDNKKSGFVKHREDKAARAEKIQVLYNSCDNGQAFADALKKEGYEIAQGKSRGFVLVDDTGKIHSLSRQLKGQRAKDIKAHLVDLKDLPDAKELAQDKQYFDRDKQNQEQLQRIEDAAIDKAKQEQAAEKVAMKAKRQPKKRLPFPANDEQQPSPSEPTPDKKPQKSLTVEWNLREGKKKEKPKIQEKDPVTLAREQSEKWDRIVEQGRAADRKRMALQDKLKGFYKREEQVQKIEDLQKLIGENDNVFGKMSGKLKTLQDELKAQELSLKDIDQRIAEQTGALEKDLAQSKIEPDVKAPEPTPEPKPVVDLEDERKRRKEVYKEQVRQQAKNGNQDKEHDLGR